ncbi:WhiB family transcriptional regulator [Nonomuraea sp. NPDC005650]|uniref:WhiB family transcriptional regulator n=1 Tax=Nonomuraea sp. NPDC005650 TaxID=3157045 RepID=UPI0033B9509C
MNTTDNRSAPACAGADPELFFPITDNEDGPAFLQIQEAKAICAGCPIRESCLEDGMDEPYGVFGGTTPKERRRLRFKRGQASAGQFLPWAYA